MIEAGTLRYLRSSDGASGTLLAIAVYRNIRIQWMVEGAMEQWLLPAAVLVAALIQAATALFVALRKRSERDTPQS